MRKFSLVLNTAKSTDYIEECFKQKLFRIKFATKTSMGVFVYLPQKWSYRAAKIYVFEMLLCSKMRKFTLEQNAAKITDYNKKHFK